MYRNATWQDLLDRFIDDDRLEGVLSAWCAPQPHERYRRSG